MGLSRSQSLQIIISAFFPLFCRDNLDVRRLQKIERQREATSKTKIYAGDPKWNKNPFRKIFQFITFYSVSLPDNICSHQVSKEILGDCALEKSTGINFLSLVTLLPEKSILPAVLMLSMSESQQNFFVTAKIVLRLEEK